MDALSRAEAAVSLIDAGDVRAAKRALRASLRELDRRPQRLPSWVVVGALVEWVGEGGRTVYRVTEVKRGRPWSFQAEELHRSSSVMYFHQERGRRYWRKFVKRQLPLFSEQEGKRTDE